MANAVSLDNMLLLLFVLLFMLLLLLLLLLSSLLLLRLLLLLFFTANMVVFNTNQPAATTKATTKATQVAAVATDPWSSLPSFVVIRPVWITFQRYNFSVVAVFCCYLQQNSSQWPVAVTEKLPKLPVIFVTAQHQPRAVKLS